MYKDTSLASETRRQARIKKEKEKEEEKNKKDLDMLTDTSLTSDDLDVIQEQHDTFGSNIQVEHFPKNKVSPKIGSNLIKNPLSEKLNKALGEHFR